MAEREPVKGVLLIAVAATVILLSRNEWFPDVVNALPLLLIVLSIHWVALQLYLRN